jgi:hypothetical protein
VGYCQNGRGSWGKRARNQRRRFQWRSKAGGWRGPWRVGPTRQRGVGKGIVPLRVSPAGPRASSGAGPKRCPGSSFMFLFSFLLFPFWFQICFQIFCKKFQFKANKFLVPSIITAVF